MNNVSLEGTHEVEEQQDQGADHQDGVESNSTNVTKCYRKEEIPKALRELMTYNNPGWREQSSGTSLPEQIPYSQLSVKGYFALFSPTN